MRSADAGTVLPLVVLCFLLAGTLLTASVAASAAFLAHRQLVALCDGAALAGAAALDRTALDRTALGAPGTSTAGTSTPTAAESPVVAGDPALALDPVAVGAAVERYRTDTGQAGLAVVAGTDGRTVTTRCRRMARVPFGAVLGRPDGIERTAVARARSVLLTRRPST